MTPEQIIARIEFLSPTAWDGFRVRMYKGRKLLLQGTHDEIYDKAHLFVLFTKITGHLPFDDDDRERYTGGEICIDLVQKHPELELRLHYARDRVIPVTCGRIYFASTVRTPDTVEEIVDLCFALHDDYDYARYFKVPGPLDAAEIDRLIARDEDHLARLARRKDRSR